MTTSITTGRINFLLAALSIAAVSSLPATPANAAGKATITADVAQLNTRLTASYGKLGGEYGALQSQVAGIASAAKSDAKAQGGKLTAAQTATFVKELSEVGQLISNAQSLGAPSGQWMANHPVAAKILNSAESINAELSNDYGNLGGHYLSLELTDDAIHAAVKNTAVAQGGKLTAAEVTRFDSELSNLQNLINQDQ